MIETSEDKNLLKISLSKKNVKNLKTLNQKIYENEELLVTSENIYKLINCFDKNFFLNRQDKLLIPIALKKRNNFFNITKEDDNLSFSKTHSIKSLTMPYFLKNIFLQNLIFKEYQKYGLSQVSHVAHIAHFGGFILAYATLPILKRNIEWEGEIELEEIKTENPFEGVDDLVKRLHEEGDEKETRQAWLEEIAERANCPVCEGSLYVKKMRIRCESASCKIAWP